MIKKTVWLCVMAAAMLFSASPVFAINDLGQFSYWYSDESRIGYYNSSTVKVFYIKSAYFEMTDTNFKAIGNAGVDAWASALGTTRSTGTSSDYNLRYFGISRSEANNMGFPKNANAATTVWGSSTLVGTGTSPSGTSKSVYSISKTTTYIIYDSTGTEGTKNSGFTLGKWKAIAAHEFGHAAGYAGHDLNATSANKSLMYDTSNTFYDVWSVSTPQTRDINHMGNVY